MCRDYVNSHDNTTGVIVYDGKDYLYLLDPHIALYSFSIRNHSDEVNMSFHMTTIQHQMFNGVP